MFLKNQAGHRPVFGGSEKFQNDPHWRDCLLFYEYFHGDNGAGLGASHQTGWTGAIARLMHLFATLTPETVLAGGKIKGPLELVVIEHAPWQQLLDLQGRLAHYLKVVGDPPEGE